MQALIIFSLQEKNCIWAKLTWPIMECGDPYMSDSYLFRKYWVCALPQKRTLSQKNYFKVMTSSRMYRIFVILAILMTSSSDDVIKFSNFEFWNSFTFIVWSYCEKIKCLSLTTLKLLLFTFWIFSVLSQFWRF